MRVNFVQNLFLAPLMAASLCSCVGVTATGSLNNEQALSFKSSVAIRTSKRIHVSAGTHSASLEFTGKHAYLKIDGVTPIPFIIPKNAIQLPDQNGEDTISLSKDQTRQSYDLEGKVKTSITRSSLQSGYENCLADVYATGTRYVEFYHVRTQRDYTLNLVDNNAVVGAFSGSSIQTGMEFTREDDCNEGPSTLEDIRIVPRNVIFK